MSESENCIDSMSGVRRDGPDEPPTPQGALRQAFARPHPIPHRPHRVTGDVPVLLG
jgi:hypothetical protein